MRIKTTEHVYTIDGTEQEVREFKARMYEKYEQVDVYPTPFDDRVVCKEKRKEYVECPLCDSQMHYTKNAYWSCYDCPAILMEYVNKGDAHKVADKIEE